MVDKHFRVMISDNQEIRIKKMKISTLVYDPSALSTSMYIKKDLTVTQTPQRVTLHMMEVKAITIYFR